MLLPRLDIRGFRALADVSIAPLGRVNLITGRNGVGKSSVLEAVALFAGNGHPLEVMNQLTARDELALPTGKSGGTPWAGVFHRSSSGAPPSIRIKGGDAASTVSLSILDVRSPDGAAAIGTSRGLAALNAQSSGFVLETRRGDELLCLVGLDGDVREASLERLNIGAFDRYRVPCPGLPAGGLHPDDVESLWDLVTIAQREEEVAAAVRVVAADVSSIKLINRSDKEPGRMPIVFRTSSREAQALASLGDGATRAFHIAVVLESAANGFALLDEFENGVHHSTQVDLWRMVFRVAAERDVQVFASTHSRDCIEAFQQASAESSELGTLIRLDQRDGVVRAHVFDEPTLEAAVTVGLEVR